MDINIIAISSTYCLPSTFLVKPLDIFCDMENLPLILPDVTSRTETSRFGPFMFRIGVNPEDIAPLYQRVLDAHTRFNSSPLYQVANKLELEVVVSSIFGTNSIEGGTLTEEETQIALELDPATVAKEEQRRAVNLN